MTLPTSLTTLLESNTREDFVFAVGAFAAVYIVLYVFRCFGLTYVKKLSARTSTQLDDAIIEMLQGINVQFYTVVSVAVASRFLVLPLVVLKVIEFAILFVVINECIKLVERLIWYGVIKKEGEDEDNKVSGVIRIAVKIVLWALGLLLILSNLGFNVTSLMAGLGIGGLAISLALQHVLADIFSSFSIALDKPFKEGDFIVVGEHKGTVKHVGLKTTRIEALQGEEIVISNAELTSTARIQNFKKMEKRRILFNIGVTYDTPTEKLKKIPDIIESIIRSKEDVEFDRAKFFEFGDFSLNIQIVYYMLTSDYLIYMERQQAINLEILDAFAIEGIEIAFPTQTLHLVKED